MRTDLPSKRYLELIDQLGERLGKRRGWHRVVAEQLGVDRSFVYRLVEGQRSSVSDETIETACKKLHLEPTYFTDASVERPDFTNYLSGSVQAHALFGADAPQIINAVFDLGSARQRPWSEILALAPISRADRIRIDTMPPEEFAEACAEFANAVLNQRMFLLARHLVSLPPGSVELAVAMGMLAADVAALAEAEGTKKRS